MLILTRNTQSATNTIQIGDNIVIKVVRVEGGSVRLAIDAPKELAIVRSELLKELS